MFTKLKLVIFLLQILLFKSLKSISIDFSASASTNLIFPSHHALFFDNLICKSVSHKQSKLYSPNFYIGLNSSHLKKKNFSIGIKFNPISVNSIADSFYSNGRMYRHYKLNILSAYLGYTINLKKIVIKFNAGISKLIFIQNSLRKSDLTYISNYKYGVQDMEYEKFEITSPTKNKSWIVPTFGFKISHLFNDISKMSLYLEINGNLHSLYKANWAFVNGTFYSANLKYCSFSFGLNYNLRKQVN